MNIIPKSLIKPRGAIPEYTRGSAGEGARRKCYSLERVLNNAYLPWYFWSFFPLLQSRFAFRFDQ